jgi:hypothetical protein
MLYIQYMRNKLQACSIVFTDMFSQSQLSSTIQTLQHIENIIAAH